MATFRVEKIKGYTIMSNYHLRDINISLKAKGLLSQMLSLPENWDYTMYGLAKINKESIDAVRTAIHELETFGYIARKRVRNIHGQLKEAEYFIYEIPHTKSYDPEPTDPIEPTYTSKSESIDNIELNDTIESEPIGCIESAESVKFESDKVEFCEPELDEPKFSQPKLYQPNLKKPMLDEFIQDNQTQLNTYILNTNIQSTDLLSTDQKNTKQQTKDFFDIESIYQASTNGNKGVIGAISAYREIIKDNISYDALCSQYDTEKVSEILELIIDTLCNGRRTIRIGGVNMNSELVKAQFLKLDMNHIAYVLNCMEKNTTEIKNIKSYLLTALYNAYITINNYYSAVVNHDLASNQHFF